MAIKTDRFAQRSTAYPAAPVRFLAPQFTRRPQAAEHEVEFRLLEGEALTQLGNASLSRYVLVNSRADVHDPFDTNHPQFARITKPLPGDRLDVTVVINVDGRNGLASARAWGKTDTYVIEVKHPDGRVERMTDIPAQGLSTAMDFSVRLQRGKTAIAAWPVGSNQVDGYGMRLFEVTYAPPRQNR